MAMGKVKWWDVKKGFGFVVSAENVDVFVHFSVIQDEGFRRLKNDEVVEYEGHRKRRAVVCDGGAAKPSA